MIRTHRIRLNPTPEQATYFVRAAGTRRFVYNWGLAEWKRQYEAGEKPLIMQLKKQFNAIKRDQFPWVYEVTKSVVEGAFMDLGVAFKNFFEGLNSGRNVGYPQFKSKKRSRDGFYVANDCIKLGAYWLKLPHIGKVNLAERLRFAGKIMSVRITRSADWWFASIAVEMPDTAPAVHPGGAVGIDLGLNRLATLSDGTELENQQFLRRKLRKLKRLQRSLKRKQAGSNNYEKARRQLARQHYRVRCARDDLLHKFTTHLTREFALIAIEDLHVKGMVKNRRLALSLSDAAFGRFVDLLEHKALNTGTLVVKVSRFYASSKTCSGCGNIKSDLTLSKRVYVCEDCGLQIDRDYNASLNILNEGLRLVGAT